MRQSQRDGLYLLDNDKQRAKEIAELINSKRKK